ncbi:sua5/YciO/YrdC/YwlC family protein [Phascolarctobacterium succinatutens CAG:287]|uniref:Threonylcarbamoyl-AMP synthase n=1 Tax=Phascolarctobacterium succinatutens CAG:287 TaxID=1263101 RepID=R6Y2S7_9FIRM|nr:L-threonylcarbamoyladenylate synthase [Phascolarctobacterium succinatutens]CDD12737.1 sua5/YciO/YrdC/YwlC family protein [Phascolarctobacterium succinatutens CAG:287]
MKTSYWKLQKNSDNQEIMQEAAALIRAGEVVSFPTETVYGLGADGLNPEAVAKIFAAKGRPNDNPLILHIAKKEDIAQLTTGLNANAKKLMEHFWPGPLTLIVNKSAIVPDAVSAGLETVAVRFPSNKFAQDFIRACGCPIAAPSANISGRPSPTNAQDVLEDMQGKIAGMLDGGNCGIGLESTVVDTTSAVPTILRPGGITYEMLTEVMGAVEIDPALQGDKNFKPKAPGMKYRHYAPKAPVYLFEGAACERLPQVIAKALAEGKTVGVLCGRELESELAELVEKQQLQLSCWGDSREQLAADLFYLLRDFDRTCPDVILAEGVEEDGLGLAIMNRLRKAAGYQIITLENGSLHLKNNINLPSFMLQ